MPLDDETLAKIALDHGFLTLAELRECLTLQHQAAERPSLGAILVSRGHLTPEALDQIAAAARADAKGPAAAGSLEDSLFGRILLRRKLIRPEQVRECLELQQRFRNEFAFPLRLGEIMVRRGYLTRRQVQETLQQQQKLELSCERCGDHVTVPQAEPLDPTAPYLCGKCAGR